MSIVVVTLSALVAAANVAGSGVAKTEKRALTPFTQVSSSGSFEVDVAAGDAPSADVTADDNVLASIITEVKDGVLKVRTKDGDNVSPKTPVVIKVTASAPLAAVEHSGSGKVAVVDVPAKALALSSSGSGALSWTGPADGVTVKSSGSGSTTLTGKAAKLDATLSGSGKIDAGAFEGQDGKASLSGSGALHVNATATLDVSLSGSGRVTYAGSPKLTKKVSGSGKIVAKDAVAVEAPKKSGGW